MIVHEDGLFGSGMAKLLGAQLPERGFQVLETIAHPTPSRDMSNVALRIRALQPDLIIPSSYYGEFVLLARTMQQQRIKPKAGVYAVLNGAASNFRFVKEFPEAANNIMDCNHWADPRKPLTAEVRKAAEATGRFWLYNIPLNYSCVRLLADAIERAGAADRGKVIEALASSTFDGHIMPYGPTKFENGQNTGAGPVNTQVQSGDIKLIFPREFLSVFNSDGDLLDVAVDWLRIQAIGYFVMGLGMVFSQSYNTAGDTLVPMVAVLVSYWFVQQPLAIVLPDLGFGAIGIAWAILVGLAVRLLIYVPYYFTGRWMRVRL